MEKENKAQSDSNQDPGFLQQPAPTPNDMHAPSSGQPPLPSSTTPTQGYGYPVDQKTYPSTGHPPNGAMGGTSHPADGYPPPASQYPMPSQFPSVGSHQAGGPNQSGGGGPYQSGGGGGGAYQPGGQYQPASQDLKLGGSAGYGYPTVAGGSAGHPGVAGATAVAHQDPTAPRPNDILPLHPAIIQQRQIAASLPPCPNGGYHELRTHHALGMNLGTVMSVICFPIVCCCVRDETVCIKCHEKFNFVLPAVH